MTQFHFHTAIWFRILRGHYSYILSHQSHNAIITLLCIAWEHRKRVSTGGEHAGDCNHTSPEQRHRCATTHWSWKSATWSSNTSGFSRNELRLVCSWLMTSQHDCIWISMALSCVKWRFNCHIRLTGHSCTSEQSALLRRQWFIIARHACVLIQCIWKVYTPLF